MPKRIPSYRRHRPTNQAVVTLNGRDHYLGKWNTAESKQAYDRLVAEWLERGQQAEPTDVLTVNQLIIRYMEFGRDYYQKNGKPTAEVDCIRAACRWLKQLYGRTPAASFGPVALRAVREKMIEAGWTRKTINDQTMRIRRMFKWASSVELVPAGVYHALVTVSGLRKGRSAARESVPVRPVAEAVIEETLPHLSRTVAAMVRVQLLTGMRPGELCMMRGCDIDMSGRVWTYRPESHKTEHHGKRREVYIGPAAQDVIRPFLRLDTQAYLFSPRDAAQEHIAMKSANRRTPRWPSHMARNERKRKPNRKRPPAERYTSASYAKAIRRACERAYPPPDNLSEAERENWRKAHHWHPHQLRHNAGTRLRKEYGVELARIILGHATAFTTEIYAEADRKSAMDVIGKIG